MSVVRVTEITSSSTKGFEDAVRNGIQRAGKTLDNIKSAWIQEQSVVVDGDSKRIPGQHEGVFCPERVTGRSHPN